MCPGSQFAVTWTKSLGLSFLICDAEWLTGSLSTDDAVRSWLCDPRSIALPKSRKAMVGRMALLQLTGWGGRAQGYEDPDRSCVLTPATAALAPARNLHTKGMR